MTRKELINSPEYWVTSIRLEVYNTISDSGLTRQQLTDKSGIDRSYIDRIMNDSRELNLNTAVKLLMACGKVPKITIEELKDQK